MVAAATRGMGTTITAAASKASPVAVTCRGHVRRVQHRL